MSPGRGQHEELQELLAALREGEATPQQQERLTTLVAGDPDLAASYVEYVQLCALLQWRLGGLQDPVLHAPGQTDVGPVCRTGPPVAAKRTASLRSQP